MTPEEHAARVAEIEDHVGGLMGEGFTTAQSDVVDWRFFDEAAWVIAPGAWKIMKSVFIGARIIVGTALVAAPLTSMRRRAPAAEPFQRARRSTKFSGMHKYPWRHR